MTNNYVCETYIDYIKTAKVPTVDFSKPLCILVDLDGTTAYSPHRAWHEDDKVKDDLVNITIRTMLEHLPKNISILFFTGRSESCRRVTEEWVSNNFSHYHGIIMRPDGNEDKDDDLKELLYNKYIKDKYSVLGVFEDRPVCIKRLRELGLFVFDCNQSTGNFVNIY